MSCRSVGAISILAGAQRKCNKLIAARLSIRTSPDHRGSGSQRRSMYRVSRSILAWARYGGYSGDPNSACPDIWTYRLGRINRILSPQYRMDEARRGHSAARGTPPRHGPVNRVLCPCRADPAGVRAPGGTHFQKKTLDRTKTGFYRTIIRCPERGGGTPKLHLGARAFALVRAWQVCISLVGLQDRSHPETGRCD